MTGMRRFGWLIAIAAALTVVPPAAAQLMRDHEKEGGVRGFHGPRPLGGIKRSFQSDAEARAEFERIVAAVGLSGIADRITLRASAETPNAEAFIGKSGERFIFYNALFMQKVKQRTAEHWSLVSILAHEIGHHVRFHTEVEGRWHEFELEADYFSGFVLGRLGATLDQAETAMRLIGTKEASQTHPGLDQRLQVIAIGWTDAGSGGPPGGFKQPPPGPQSGADAEALAKERERLALLQKQQEEERQRADAKRKVDEEAARRDPVLSVKPGSSQHTAFLPEILLTPANAVPECVTPGRLMAFLKMRNPELSPRYGSIASDYMRLGELLGVRWDFAFYQMIVETGALSYWHRTRVSDVRPEQNNFAGLGATGGGESGESFKDIETGVRAHLEQVLLYAGRPVANPVAERTREVQSWGILTAWQKGFTRPINYADLVMKWASGTRQYGNMLQTVAERFHSDVCKAPDPRPELLVESRRAIAKARAK